MTEYVDHNLIRPETIGRREYQDYLVEKSSERSTLVVLPTGTGKTIVSLRVTADRILENRGGTSLLLSPTKPLVEQHYDTYTDLLDIHTDNIVKFTGDVRPKERKQIWEDEPSVVIATPQVIENDLISDRISLQSVVHLTFDECHRATGEYSYVYIADKYTGQADDPLITGLTASPGDTKEEILKICDNINVDDIEIITEDDPMIEEYIYQTEIDTRFIDISDEVIEVRDKLQEVYKDRLEKLYDNGFIDSRSKTVSQGKLNRARKNIQKEMKKDNSEAYQAMSIWAESMKLNRAIELIETQGPRSFLDYYERLETELRTDDASKAVQRLVSDRTLQDAVSIAQEFDGEYEKISVLKSELVTTVKIDGGKSLVFTKSRDTVEALADKLSDSFSVGRLVGQKDTENSPGMSQTEQKKAVEKFSKGEYEVLISTQIGEEGLDISEVDLVVFYEPASRGIERIQRQGRTGRSQKGRVVMLIGNDTRDVGMYYKSKNNMEQMKSDVSELQGIGSLQDEIEEEIRKNRQQTTLQESFNQSSNQSSNQSDEPDQSEDDDTVSIVADSRETNSSVVRTLDTDQGVSVDVEANMEVGDYVVSDQCVVERKDVTDFHDTITGDRSIFEQVKNMADSYDRPVLLIEGDHAELYTQNIHPNAVRGVLATIVSDFNTTVIESIDEDDTAGILKQLASREQDDSDTTVNPHGNKDTQSVTAQQEYIVGSVESIGPKTAEALLDHFGSPIEIFTAEKEELQEVPGIGEQTADKIYSILRTEY